VFRLSLTNGSYTPLKFNFPVGDYTNEQDPIFTAAQGMLFVRGALPTNSSVSDVNATDMRVARASDGRQLWKIDVTTSASPIVANGLVYCITFFLDTGSWVRAYRLADGKLAWQQQMPALPYPTGVSLLSADQSRVYAGSNDHALHCFDAHTGAPIWRFQAGGQVRGPTAVGDLVYVGSEDYSLYAIEARTGKLRWSFTTNGGIVASPTVDSGVVYTGSWLSLRAGRRYWPALLERLRRHESEPGGRPPDCHLAGGLPRHRFRHLIERPLRVPGG
jgi:outer membrane protein assembly factor BamB